MNKETILKYNRVIINDSVITRTDEEGVNINTASTALDVSSLDKFITKSRMIITKSEDCTFRCVFMDCYYLANLRLDPVTISI
jgi:hypothetical protein